MSDAKKPTGKQPQALQNIEANWDENRSRLLKAMTEITNGRGGPLAATEKLRDALGTSDDDFLFESRIR